MAKLYVAVVTHRDRPLKSLAHDNTWKSFVGPNKSDVTAQGLAAAAQWGAKYIVLVGTLTFEAQQVSQFNLVPLTIGGK